MKKKHYLVYKTTNLLNGKIYIGQHQTYNINDGYVGSGIMLKQAIKKYGIANFKREILFDFNSFEEMDNKERELVNEDFVARPDTYNLCVGGQGNEFDLIIKLGLNNSVNNNILGSMRHKELMMTNTEYRKSCIHKLSLARKKLWREHPEVFYNFKYDWVGKHHTEETKKKISEKAKLRIGEKNNTFGTTWICNLELKENKKVKKELVDVYLKTGWILGRRMSFYKKS